MDWASEFVLPMTLVEPQNVVTGELQLWYLDVVAVCSMPSERVAAAQ